MKTIICSILFINSLTIIFILLGCQEKQMLRDLNGTFVRPYPNPCIYNDSSSQILFESTQICFDSKKETFKWSGGNIEGQADVKFIKSDRGNKNELKMSINNADLFAKMLPDENNVNYNLVQNSKIYINPSKKRLSLHIVIDGNESTYYYEIIK